MYKSIFFHFIRFLLFMVLGHCYSYGGEYKFMVDELGQPLQSAVNKNTSIKLNADFLKKSFNLIKLGSQLSEDGGEIKVTSYSDFSDHINDQFSIKFLINGQVVNGLGQFSILSLQQNKIYVQQYISAKNEYDDHHNLLHCTLDPIGASTRNANCDVLKNNALDANSRLMGLSNYPMNEQGVVAAWYQDQSTKPLVNKLSVFSHAPVNERVLYQGDSGQLISINHNIVAPKAIGSIASRPALFNISNDLPSYLFFPDNYSDPMSGATSVINGLSPIAIDDNEQPRVILLENAYNEEVGRLFSCQTNQLNSNNANNGGQVQCVGGLQLINVPGLWVNNPLRWYLSKQGLLIGNLFSAGNFDKGVDPRAVVVDINSMSMKSLYQTANFTGDEYSSWQWYVQNVDKKGDVLALARSNSDKGLYKAFVLENTDADGDGFKNSIELNELVNTDPNDANSVPEDMDSDGIPDVLDDDVDGDGFNNELEAQLGTDSKNSNSIPADFDGDGLPDVIDEDIDNDGINNDYEEFVGSDPRDRSDVPLGDLDSDGTYDHLDDDIDGDGVINDQDLYPFNRLESKDTDGDGVGDYADRFDNNPEASVDADRDGLPDSWHVGCDVSCQNASGLTLDTRLNDTDNDGFTNDIDRFRNNPAASIDDDRDGLVDRFNSDCDSVCQENSGLTLDQHLNDYDNDGVIDSVDAFRYDPYEQYDTDGDGIGNNRDNDDDGDGYLDSNDDFPLDPTRFEDYEADTDGDGIPDYIEDTTSGIYSHIVDSQDDEDDDGLTNLQEYQLGTGILIKDSDSDGLPDGYEVDYLFDPLNPSEGELDADFDEDNWSNILEYQALTDPRDALVFPSYGMIKWVQEEILNTYGASANSQNVVAADGTLYLTTSNKKLYSIAPDSTINWVKSTQNYYVTPSIADNGSIYLADKNELSVFNPDGTLIWSKPGQWRVSLGEFGRAYIYSNNDRVLVSLDERGSEIWRVNSQSSSRPIVGIDKIYITDGSILKAYNKAGVFLWQYQDDNALTVSIDARDQTLVVLGYRELVRLSSEGEVIQSHTLNHNMLQSSLRIDKNSNIYIHANYSNTLFAFDKHLSQKWVRNIYSGTDDLIVDSQGRLYVHSSGKLFAFDSEGNQLWVVNGVSGLPVLVSEHLIQVGVSLIQIPESDDGFGYWGHSGRGAANTNSICSKDDIDCDGLPSNYEVLHGFDPLVFDSNLDVDADGLNNLEEYQYGTNPQSSDSDADLMPDGIEVIYGTNPITDDSHLDLDEDGFDNLSEYQSGSDLNNDQTGPDAVDGQLRWRRDYSFDHMTTDQEGNIFGYSDGQLVALDERGLLVWTLATTPLTQEVALYSSTHLLIINESGIHYVRVSDGVITSSILGEYSKSSKVKNGLIVSDRSERIISHLDSSGSVLWSTSIDFNIKHMAVNADGVIYLGGENRNVAAVSPYGVHLWNKEIGYYSILPFSIDALGNLVLSDSREVYRISPSGNIDWKTTQTTGYIFNTPLLDSNDQIIMFDDSTHDLIVSYSVNGVYSNLHTIPQWLGSPGKSILDGEGVLIVPLDKEIHFYYDNELINSLSFGTDEYVNKEIEPLLINDRLIISTNIRGGGKSSLYSYYYKNSLENIGWSGAGGSRYKVNSVCGLIDSDCDGLTDGFEISIGLDPNENDVLSDKDQDGIINIREIQLGLNLTSDDTDNDGIKDNFELLNGLDPLFDDANDDADQDGYSNLVEYQAGSDINDASATALLETGVKQWEKTVSSRNFIVGPDSTSYVIEGDDVIAYSVKGFELWRNLAPNQYWNRSRGMMLANSEHLAILSQYQLVVYDVITGEQLWKVDGSFDTFAANGSGQIYLSSNQGLFLYDLSGSIVRQLDSNSPHNQLIVDNDGGYYFTPSRYIYAYDVQGNRIWTKSYSQTPQNLMLDPAGDIRFISSGELYKLDSSGNEKWRRKPSYPNSSNYRSVIGLNGTSYLYGSNYTMVAIDEDGKELWNKSIGYSIDSDLSIDKDNSIKFLSNSKLISVDSKGISSELALGSSYRPYSLTITDEQLFVSDGNKISKLYSDQKGLAFSWATKGAGNHYRNSPCGLTDDDCDGLPNSYEIEVGLNPQLHDILNDTDGDGLNNITELGLGTDMFARDTDSDGMPDKYEYTFGLDLLSHDAFEDADADGFTNFDEYSVKSDPNDPLSTALRENGAQQWSQEGQFKESAVDHEQNSFVLQGSSLVKFDQYGNQLWQTNMGYSDFGMLPIIVSDSLLLVQNSVRNNIQAYDSHTGRFLWAKNESNPRVVVDRLGSIYVGNSSRVKKLSHGGSEEWSRSVDGYGLLINLDDGLVSYDSRSLYSYSDTGELLWRLRLDDNIHNIVMDLHGDYYLTHSRAVSKVNRFGQLLWTKQVGNSPTIPLIDFNSNFYTKTDNYDVKKFDLNGNLIWSSRLAANATGEMTLAGDGKLYVPHYQSISIISADGTVEALSIPNQRSIFSVKPIEQSLFIASELSYRRVFNNGSKAGSVWSSKFGGLHNKGIIYNHDDLDGDGLSDSFEQSVGLDHTRKDTLLDADNDGVNNITELQLGLDLFNIDSDLDGMKDGYEVSFGLNPKVNDASLDLDQDGYSNLQEFIAGSIPNDASSIASSDIGSKRWITNLGYTQFALGAGGKVFAWSNHILYGLDQYGREMWQTPIRSLNQDPISLPDNKVILLDDDNLSLLDGNSGAILWQVTGGDYYHALLGKNRNIYALDRNRYLVSFDLSGQKVLSTTRRYDSLVRQADGTILGTDGNDIYQIDEYGVRFGERSRGRDDFAPLALTLDSSVIGSVNNYLHKFSSSGYELWRFDAERHSSETELYSPLVDSLGNSYTLFDDILIAVDPFGSEWWRIDVSDAKGAPVLAADGRIFIPGQQKVLVITANLSSSSVGGIKTTIPMPDLRYHYKIQVVGDQLLVAGRNQLESIYIGNASENTSLVGWTSTLGGSHNGSMICGLEDFDCEPSPNNSLPNSSNDFSSDSNQ